MQIESTTHEHGPTAKVYTYEGDYELHDQAIAWTAQVSHPEQPTQMISGTIPVTAPGVASLADKAVRDAIVKHIDAFGSARPARDTSALPRQMPPVRTRLHDALTMFVGHWEAEGLAYGGPGQSETDPRRAPQPWQSTHTARWHTGRFFVVQDERAFVGDDPFDTLGVMGLDAQSGRLYAHCIENHGFERRYELTVDGRLWTFDGTHERATIEFSADGRTQRISWEWRPRERWLPLCDRTAVRVD